MSTIVYDGPDKTIYRDVFPDQGAVSLREVPKQGSQDYNRQQLEQAAEQAIATLTTYEATLAASSTAWDSATGAQRNAVVLALVRQNRVLIRLVLGLLDAAS